MSTSTSNRVLTVLLSSLEQLDDNRRSQGKRHPQGFILSIVMFATMSGYLGYRAIGDFIDKHKKQLVYIFKPEKDRVPSFSTVRRVLMKVDFDQFTIIYKDWLGNSLPESDQIDSWYSIDGKALRGTITGDNSNEYVHLVSIFSAFDKIVVDTGKVKDKSNEIPLVQKLIKESSLERVIFTLDALHCQKETTKNIIESNNDYVIAVKENQPKLYKQIRENIKETDPVSIDYTLEKNKGRKEERELFVYDNLENIDPDWMGLKRIIQVNRRIDHIKAQKMTEETVYYITSLIKDAADLNQGVRAHWHIENTLHWTKDVVFKEDASKIRTGNAPENISLIKNWVMAVFRKNGFKSMTKAVRKTANDIKFMIKLLE